MSDLWKTLEKRTQLLSTVEEIAWSAGFFDGEGWVGTGNVSKKQGGMYIRVYISQKFPEVLHKFQKAVGVGKVNGPHRQGPKMMYAFQCSASGDVKHIFDTLKPYLCPIKIKQFEDAITNWEARPTKHSRRI